ncbi:pilus assembly protein CpaF [Frondihabitans sp. PAMC 28766]|uniref:TadA family conjugal transfer-associated ATPase n=1 Tax=Frondihabitans sp. PAMC 28766 TaxID=1795630 RepID=UPI00078BD5D7|nr:TadA family conjugal transfer-associated ATPase [Frondihabitans sp. PAMC 28766]AMM21778.1 pilus assembly protein CpaF [Frondihabitans sp. PAMC 28766]
MPDQFGPLARILADPAVTDAFVNAAGDVWVVRGCGVEPLLALRLEPDEVRRLAVRLVALGGRHVDEATPCADVRLADGLRVHVVLPPVARDGTVLSVRAPRVGILRLDDLDDGRYFSFVDREVVERLVARRANLLITGAAGTGKTTLLAALLSGAPPTERIVTIEDVAELRVDHPHVVALETRQANLEGAGRIDLARLVREALRMRPDRLVVGECRGVEIRELLSALSTGHDGGAGTLHANGLDAVPARLEALGALAGLTPESVARQAVSAFDAVLHLEAVPGDRGGTVRRIAGLASFTLDASGRLQVDAEG